MVSSEHTVPRRQDQQRRWYATRVWHCSGGELTCVRTYVPYESRKGLQDLRQLDWLTADTESQGDKQMCLTN
jgi:hypothetical protein